MTESSATGPIFVGLGSNLGDRVAHLRFARDRLVVLPETELLALSSLYESKAAGPGMQPRYLNAVASLRSDLAPRALLVALLGIEKEAGRVRAARNEARTLDLDLLLYGDLQIDEPGLVIPHPRILERAFVLLPLAELAPTRLHPVRRETFSTLASQTPTAAWCFEAKSIT